MRVFGLDDRRELSSGLYLDRKTFPALAPAERLKAVEHMTLRGDPYGGMGNRKGGQRTEPTLLSVSSCPRSSGQALDILCGELGFPKQTVRDAIPRALRAASARGTSSL